MTLFIIRYGEVGLKSKAVRRRFENALKKNIAERFIQLKQECRIELDWGRVYLWSDDEDQTIDILYKTFGIVSFSKAVECSSDKEEVFMTAAEVSKPLFKKGMSFRVKARRTGQHDYTSMELAKEAGSAVWNANEEKGPSVNLTNPDLTFYIEVRQNKAYVFSEVMPGPGGMPLGTQGRILGIVNNERGAAACWLMMKRGCKVIVSTDDEDLIMRLRDWDPNIKVVDPAPISEANELAHRLKAEGVVFGWRIDDLEKYQSQLGEASMPIFHPLIGMDDVAVRGVIGQVT
jgi:thiamine biosynthesis protein ThiI